jgi:SPP1 gp7 family putative phage head morphogenesis protein
MRTVHARYLEVLAPHLEHIAMRKDGITKHGEELRKLDKQASAAVGKAFDRMARKVAKTNEQALKSMGIHPTNSASVAQARAKNIELISKAEDTYHQQIVEVLEDPDNFGLRVEELAKLLGERGEVSESRAELIARDQTSKLNAALNEERQTAAGVAEYVWSTSKDERVRESHKELEGETFSWSSPPIIDGEPLNPGEDICCRCIAVPVI